MQEYDHNWAVASMKGLWLIDQGRLEEAIDLFSSRVAECPRDSYAYFKLADAYFHTGNFAQAERAFRKGLDIDPSIRIAWSMHARCLHKLGRSKDALLVLEESFSRSPDYPNVLLEMAGIYLDTGETDKAISVLFRAVNEHNCLTAEALEQLSEIYLQTRKYEEALPLLTRLIKLRPKKRRAYLNLGTALEAVGRVAEARNVWKDLLQTRIGYAFADDANQKVFEEARNALDRTRVK
jgi:tetratricopeptide (TPR) repeat protein